MGLKQLNILLKKYNMKEYVTNQLLLNLFVMVWGGHLMVDLQLHQFNAKKKESLLIFVELKYGMLLSKL